MSTSDDQNTEHDDPTTDVVAAQEEADGAPVSDDREPPEPGEDRNP